MRKLTKPLFALAASTALVTALAGLSQASFFQAEQDQPPKIIAIKFHADWCGSCKAMGPVFEELQAKYDQEPVLYVEFDQTREFDRRQSAFTAHALGLDELWKEHGGQTGFVLLIDPETKQVVQRLTHEHDLKQMGAALEDALRPAS